jgi:hypothetical protein
MKALRSSETLVTIYHAMQRNVAADLNLQQYPTAVRTSNVALLFVLESKTTF